MKSSYPVLAAILLFVLCSSSAAAEEYVYKSQCVTTQAEDISRTIQGSIYLALRADTTVAKSSISVKLKKIPQPKILVTETNLLAGLGFSFNSSDLSVSAGGISEGHTCLLPYQLLISVNVTRKNGVTQANSLSTIIHVPGSYATSTKVKASQLKP